MIRSIHSSCDTDLPTMIAAYITGELSGEVLCDAAEELGYDKLDEQAYEEYLICTYRYHITKLCCGDSGSRKSCTGIRSLFKWWNTR